MKNPEEAIERVLTGLRDAEAPAGMEERVLRAMKSRAVAEASRGWWRESMGRVTGLGEGWRLAGGAVVAGVIVLAVLVASMRKSGQVAPDMRGVRETASSRGPGKAEEFVPQRLKPLDTRGGYGTAEAVPLSKTADRETVDHEADGVSSEAEGHVDYDSLAVSEMLAPSKPAPPLSLTHQETLLAEIAHHGDPEEVAELKPEVRAKEIEIAKAEFHDFFEPPLPASAKESK